MDTIQARIQASFGHRKSSCHPAMVPYLMPRTALPIDLIDPDATQVSLDRAAGRLKALRSQGAQLLWVGNPLSRALLNTLHQQTGEPVIHHRWPGGLITNFDQVRQSPRGALEGLQRRPEVLILLAPQTSHLALCEARKSGVEVMGVVDSNMDPEQIDVPIFGNDDALVALAYYLHWINQR